MAPRIPGVRCLGRLSSAVRGRQDGGCWSPWMLCTTSTGRPPGRASAWRRRPALGPLPDDPRLHLALALPHITPLALKLSLRLVAGLWRSLYCVRPWRFSHACPRPPLVASAISGWRGRRRTWTAASCMAPLLHLPTSRLLGHPSQHAGSACMQAGHFRRNELTDVVRRLHVAA